MVHIAYNFARAQQEMSRAVRIACDVILGLVLCIVLPSKGASRYRVAALILLGVGRVGAVLQGDNEAAIKALISRFTTRCLG